MRWFVPPAGSRQHSREHTQKTHTEHKHRTPSTAKNHVFVGLLKHGHEDCLPEAIVVSSPSLFPSIFTEILHRIWSHWYSSTYFPSPLNTPGENGVRSEVKENVGPSLCENNNCSLYLMNCNSTHLRFIPLNASLSLWEKTKQYLLLTKTHVGCVCIFRVGASLLFLLQEDKYQMSLLRWVSRFQLSISFRDYLSQTFRIISSTIML